MKRRSKEVSRSAFLEQTMNFLATNNPPSPKQLPLLCSVPQITVVRPDKKPSVPEDREVDENGFAEDHSKSWLHPRKKSLVPKHRRRLKKICSVTQNYCFRLKMTGFLSRATTQKENTNICSIIRCKFGDGGFGTETNHFWEEGFFL